MLTAGSYIRVIPKRVPVAVPLVARFIREEDGTDMDVTWMRNQPFIEIQSAIGDDCLLYMDAAHEQVVDDDDTPESLGLEDGVVLHVAKFDVAHAAQQRYRAPLLYN